MAGVLEVGAAQTLPLGVPTHVGWPGDRGCWPPPTLPQSRGDIHGSGKDSRGYISGNGGFMLYAVYNLNSTQLNFIHKAL